MNFINSVKSFFSRIKAIVPYGKFYHGVFEVLGKNNSAYINKGYKYNNNVYSVIKYILRTASKTDYIMYEVKSASAKRKLKAGTPIEQIKRHGNDELVEVESHDFYTLLERPNPYMSKSRFLEAVFGGELLLGESFIHGMGPAGGMNKGIPKELNLLPQLSTSIKFTQEGLPTDYIVTIGGTRVVIPAEEVAHIKEWNPDFTTPRGQSPLDAGRLTITSSNNAYEAEAKLLQNMGVMGGLYYDNKNGEFLSETQTDQLNDSYERKYGGASNYGKIMVMSGKMNYVRFGMDAHELGLGDQQLRALRDICNIYGFPSQLLNDPDNKTFSNLKEARKELISNAVLPIANGLRDTFNNWLMPLYEERDGKDYFVDVNTMVWPELQADRKDTFEMLGKLWQLTPNQVLSELNYPESKDPAMDRVYIPTNLMDLSVSDDEGLKRLLAEYAGK